jgi:transposase
LWLIKVWFSASTFVVKIATFAKPETYMRNSFDGLHGLVVNGLSQTGLEGDVNIFLNHRRTQVKMLVWDRSGFVI